MIIAVDFDGTLFEKRVPYDGRVGKPILDIINVVKLAKRLGHKIMIFTCRSAKKNGRIFSKPCSYEKAIARIWLAGS